ncbi:diacylglycerol/lipid kinase family protein [Prauserella cavernicola]|uniref:Diacylglycerol kinase n=1 Tax=Prauserella cavernicola TaxID=2800127 RepID=A0A934QWX3_9PSEU|nr:diacylglycerol kinase family protein [Prauserella cavernicola]MBK1787054.1 diacylglycerol kinase [Prauserella cavernicola]
MGGADSRPGMRRRLASVVALLALAGAVVLPIVALVRHPWQLIAAVALLGTAVMAAWTALVHRGAHRVAATAVALLALVGAVLLPDAWSVVVLIVVVALAVLSTAAARVAIAPEEPAPRGLAVPPARHGVLLMNPRSGGGKVTKFDLEAEARRRGIEPVILRLGADLRELAERAVREGADALGMAGGDGSQALVADVARRHDLPFVCVPAGTRNHFALDLGLDRDDVAGALDAFGEAAEQRIDLALIGERVFVNNASLGVYASVVQSAHYRDAKLGTAAEMLPDLLGPDSRPMDLRFSLPDGSRAPAADLVLVSNGAYRLDRLSGFGTRARLDEGVLGVVTLTVDRARDVPALFAAEAAGRMGSFPGYREWTVPEFAVESGRPLVEVGIDGEAVQLAPPLTFRSLPGALRVRLPRTTPSVAPASELPDRLGALVTLLLRALVTR